MTCRKRLFQTILCLFIVLSPVWSRAELTESVDSEALEILKQMNDYLLSQQVVGFRAIENEEVVFDNGQKVMFSEEIRFKMARPNKFHVQRHSGESEVEMFYDSSSFTIFRKDLNFFATTNANAVAGTAIGLDDDGSGTIKVQKCSKSLFPATVVEATPSGSIGEALKGSITLEITGAVTITQ